MPSNLSFSDGQHPWAVLLAGGDGTRLRSLTLKIAGDSRPKQFCHVFGARSLLSQTRARVEPLFQRSRTMYLVTKAHQMYYQQDLRDTDAVCILAQPQNRGTGVAIALALLRIARSDADGLAAFFPCDHHYESDNAFALTVGAAVAFARKYPQSIILVAAEAHYPEVEYGWIEPGAALHDGDGGSLVSVNRFWEKPSPQTARALLRRGCLWNTFVTIGHVRTFLELMRSQIPEAMSAIDAGIACDDLDSAYRKVRTIDFSSEVLTPMPHRLLAVRDSASGWTDLGSPDRVIDTLVRNQIEPAWLTEIRCGGDRHLVTTESDHRGPVECRAFGKC